MPFQFPQNGPHNTAKALLVEALTMTEKLLDGFPIPAAKGTIGAVLHFIAEAEVCTGVKLRYFSIFIAVTEDRRERRTSWQPERAHRGAPQSTHSASSWQNGGGYISWYASCVERLHGVCGIVPFRNGLLIDGHRHIGRGLERLRHPKLSQYGRFRRYVFAKEIEGDLRMVMDLIRLDTASHLVRLARGGETIVGSPYLFVAGWRGPTPGARSPACKRPPTR